jgi:drug/metabolite transporter (DMT)-like permease
VAVVLGIFVAAAFGAGDFLGGRASQRASTPAVLLISQAVAAVGALVVSVIVSADVASSDIVNGCLAGALNVGGLGLLYLGLATGRMGVVAPVTAVVAAIVPVTYGLLEDDAPSAAVLIGVALAIVAGALIGMTRDEHSHAGTARALTIAAVAGAGLGGSFIFYAKTSDASGMWPLLCARLVAVVLVVMAVAIARARGPVTLPLGSDRVMAAGAGLLDITAATLILVAVREGYIVEVAPVASLAPAMTVLLAWWLLKEHVSRLQLVGLGVALAGLALIATG